MTRKGAAVMLLVCLLLGIPASILAYRWCISSRKAIFESCRELKPGDSFTQVLNALGSPDRRQAERSGVSAIFFKTPGYVHGSIKIEVDDASGKVITIWCGNEYSPPNWRIAP
ncbi:MAG TPA: hypothetical protein DHV16_01770 [Nitrospiraceae bacterium]|nr:MAG: hypothetical protein A2Z82_09760 [Nitrospirae bacterium GWA2_46_11]OGW25138.1 MAG: hypothetical protein A2X55_11675 [Nitrospirae bacterium GWB2_47_37]HAK89584.1 hypothetical protein [Nitrospiraceae bacterium]HCL82247.1 hypothetical protein [Nitrospiraceae bacterium]HCZ10991.1 hypothetical protein [Nitrospiraceae bacterium]